MVGGLSSIRNTQLNIQSLSSALVAILPPYHL
nr:MAG TPA: hypothetical protein [Caudoviricetes sp.]